MTQARINRMLDDVRITIASSGKIMVLTVAAALAAVAVAVTGITTPDLTAGETDAAPQQAGDFSQHANQAADVH